MLLAAAFGFQNFRHFVGGGVLLEVAENGEGGVAPYVLRSRSLDGVWGVGLLAGVLVIGTLS